MIYKMTFLTILIWFLPHFLFVSLKLSSPALGIFITSVSVLGFKYKAFFYKKFMTLSFLVILLFLLTILLIEGSFYFAFDFISKPFFSSFLFILLIFSAYILSSEIEKVSFSNLKKIIEVNLIFLLILGYTKLVYIPACCGYNLLPKPVLPFSEESHFALMVSTFLIPYSIFGNVLKLMIILIMFIFLSFLYPSLTLLLVSFLAFFLISVRVKPLFFKSFLIILPFLIIFITIFFVLKIEYFRERLVFENTTNLTTLVFLQGIELAYLNFIKTFGIGLGFQMLGTKYTYTGEYTSLINSIFKSNFNLSDGGFFASKLIAEFGLIGLIISVVYLVYIINFIFTTNKDIYYLNKLNMYWLKDSKSKTIFDDYKKYVLIKSFIISFFIEFFFRGYGYFSTSFFFVILSLIYIFRNRIKISKLKRSLYAKKFYYTPHY